MPVNIADKVRRILGFLEIPGAPTMFSLDKRLRIHGWKGAGGEIIQQILEALSYTVQVDLESLPPGERRCRIFLANGRSEHDAFAVLRVETSAMEEKRLTMRCIRGHIIQDLASRLTNGWVKGYAEFDPSDTPDADVSLDFLQIYFPLWIGHEPRRK